MDQPPDDALRRTVLACLEARGLADRLLRRGRTVRQVRALVRDDLLPAGPGLSPLADEQVQLDAVRAVLDSLVAEGLARRSRARVRHFLGTKGGRLVEVDLYRPA
ncbi:MAG: hypothetical protein H6742_21930 [Alphaproteobacteria bacterium]|nr:hypothetical protein [Alphaproteobacteria bacterium]